MLFILCSPEEFYPHLIDKKPGIQPDKQNLQGPQLGHKRSGTQQPGLLPSNPGPVATKQCLHFWGPQVTSTAPPQFCVWGARVHPANAKQRHWANSSVWATIQLPSLWFKSRDFHKGLTGFFSPLLTLLFPWFCAKIWLKELGASEWWMQVEVLTADKVPKKVSSAEKHPFLPTTTFHSNATAFSQDSAITGSRSPGTSHPPTGETAPGSSDGWWPGTRKAPGKGFPSCAHNQWCSWEPDAPGVHPLIDRAPFTAHPVLGPTSH